MASIAGCGLLVGSATKATRVGLSRISSITALASDDMRTKRIALAIFVPFTFRTRIAASFRLSAKTVTATNGLLMDFKPSRFN